MPFTLRNQLSSVLLGNVLWRYDAFHQLGAFSGKNICIL